MRVAGLLAAMLVLAGCAVGGSTKTVTVTVRQPATNPYDQATNARYFGVPVSITRLGPRYLLVLRPEFFLVGVTANIAFAAQQGTKCLPFLCPGVPDDHLVVPAGSTKLTFVLPVKTKGTVVASGAAVPMYNAVITATQLAALIHGARTPKLIDPLESGLWLTVDIDTVKSFAQQFQP